MDSLSATCDFIPGHVGVDDALTPVRHLFVTSRGSSAMLRRRAAEVGAATHRLELVGINRFRRCRGDHRDIDTGKKSRFHARYLVGADGAHSGSATCSALRSMEAASSPLT